MRLSNSYKKLIDPTAAFLLPVLLMGFALFLMDIYPFGENSILSRDMFTQYVSYFSYYQDLFKKDGVTIFYSFSKLLGGDMFGFFAYYLISPFSLVCLFFDKATLPVALVVITLLKFGFCGISMYFFLGRNKKNFFTLILSTSYAMMAYNIAFHINLMWLDGVILAPLVIWGIEKLMEEKSSGRPRITLYIFSLSLALILNYYIGFMLCLFSCLYFISLLIRRRFTNMLPSFLKFTGCSLLAGSIASCVWLPTLLSLRGGIKSGFTWDLLRLSSDHALFDLFSRLYPGSYTAGSYANRLPYVFCGIAVIFFAGIYLTHKTVSRYEKYASFFLIGIFIASFYIEGLDLIWHGLSEPIGFPYRYSFLFCLILIDLAHRGSEKALDSSYPVYVKMGLLLFFAITMLVEKVNYEWLYTKIFCLETLFFCLVLYLFHLAFRKKKKYAPLLLLVAVSTELLLNAYIMMRQFPYEPYPKYTDYVERLGGITDKIKENDSSFYRLEKQSQMTPNDPLLMGYHGVSHFSSTVVKKDMDLLEKLGMERNTTYAFYNSGSTMAIDSLLGLKYIVGYQPLYHDYKIPFTMNEMYVNQNPYALPLGFMVDQATASTDFMEKDLFLIQNSLFENMTGKSFSDLPPSADNGSVKEDSGAWDNSSLFTPAVHLHEVVNNLVETDHIYQKSDPSSPAGMTYQIKTTQKGPLYAYFTSREHYRADILVNGTSVSHYFTDSDSGILLLGEFDQGETITVDVTLMEDKLSLDLAYFYSMNTSVLKSCYQELSEEPFLFEYESDSHLKGSVTSSKDKEYLMLTIPYAPGWRVLIDGKKVQPDSSFDAFLLIPVEQGTHTIELTYRPVGLKAGLMITGLGLLILGSIFLSYKKATYPVRG